MLMKFDEAYCNHTNNILHLSELIDIRTKDKQIFYKYYASQLYCPECLIAPLLFVNANPPHLRTKGKTKHGDNCSMQQPTISTKKLDAYCDKKENYDSISIKLENLFNQLYIERNIKHNNNPCIITFRNNKNSINDSISKIPIQNSYRIPRRNINYLCSTDENTYKFFHGSVLLSWMKKSIENNWSRIYLYILSNKTKKIICTLVMTKKVFEYISHSIPVNSQPKPYTIVFLSKLERSEKNHLQCFISHSSLLLAKPFPI